MRTFHCDHCERLVFFENVQCGQCRHALAYLPDVGEMGSLEQAGPDQWRSRVRGAAGSVYRLCRNYQQENVCNWAIAASDADPLCRSCRLTRIIPDLSQPGNRAAWCRLETAKRRLVHSLLDLGLPLTSKTDDPQRGLAFEFLADPPAGSQHVLTGHKDGVITVNLAEADDAKREARRLQLHEPYRTVLGHFRHESGHHYWDRLIKNSQWLDRCRHHFGDERDNYAQALERHYRNGPATNWQDYFVSAYASTHAWEDWAETWAHYLHMVDTMETAVDCGLILRPLHPNEPVMQPNLQLRGCRPASFDQMIKDWFPLTYVLNNLNRGLGLADAYPFVLAPPAIEKLRFVHDVIASVGR